jgi:hypothetical protein
VREVAIGQGATDARSAGLRRRAGLAEAQWGEGGGSRLKRKKMGRGWAGWPIGPKVRKFFSEKQFDF